MHDNNTVQQLSEALNELLNAYDKLKNENSALQQDNSEKDNKIAELESRNNDLEEQLDQLTDTTKKHTNEIDTMLGRIKTILDDPDDTSEKASTSDVVQEEAVYDEKFPQVEPEIQQEDISIKEEEETNTDKDIEKEIDLGRMQSLLNGFNN